MLVRCFDILLFNNLWKTELASFFGLLPTPPAKSIDWLMPLLLSGIMSGVISAYNTIKSLGFIEGVTIVWLSN